MSGLVVGRAGMRCGLTGRRSARVVDGAGLAGGGMGIVSMNSGVTIHAITRDAASVT